MVELFVRNVDALEDGSLTVAKKQNYEGARYFSAPDENLLKNYSKAGIELCNIGDAEKIINSQVRLFDEKRSAIFTKRMRNTLRAFESLGDARIA